MNKKNASFNRKRASPPFSTDKELDFPRDAFMFQSQTRLTSIFHANDGERDTAKGHVSIANAPHLHFPRCNTACGDGPIGRFNRKRASPPFSTSLLVLA